MAEKLGNWKRTGMCQEFSEKDIGREVTLMGWVNSRRNLGGLIFVWLRDRSGVIQLVFDEAEKKSYFADAESLRSEFVIAVRGEIIARTPENYNDDLPTGRIEVRVEELKILSTAITPPFEIEEGSKVKEELRLKYRYLDLRRPDMQRNLILRNQIAMSARQYLFEQGFLEIETPMLKRARPRARGTTLCLPGASGQVLRAAPVAPDF